MLLQFRGVPQQFGEIVERIGAVELARMNQAHEQITVWSAKIRSFAKLPPFPNDNRDVTRRGLVRISQHNLQVVGVYGHWTKPSLGWAPVCQDLRMHEAGPDYRNAPTLSTPADGVAR